MANGLVLTCENVSGFCMGHLASWPDAAHRRCGDDACFAEKYRWHRAHRSEAAWIACLAWRFLDYVESRKGPRTGYALLLRTGGGEWVCAHGIDRNVPLMVALLEVVVLDAGQQRPRDFVNVLLVADRKQFTAVALDSGADAARLVKELPWKTLLPNHTQQLAVGGAVAASGTFAPLMWLHAALEPQPGGRTVDVVGTVAASIKPRVGDDARACPGAAGFELLLVDSFVPPGGETDMKQLLRETEVRRENTLRMTHSWRTGLYLSNMPNSSSVPKNEEDSDEEDTSITGTKSVDFGNPERRTNVLSNTPKRYSPRVPFPTLTSRQSSSTDVELGHPERRTSMLSDTLNRANALRLKHQSPRQKDVSRSDTQPQDSPTSSQTSSTDNQSLPSGRFL